MIVRFIHLLVFSVLLTSRFCLIGYADDIKQSAPQKKRLSQKAISAKEIAIQKKLVGYTSWIEVSCTQNGKTIKDPQKLSECDFFNHQISIWERRGEVSPGSCYYKIDASSTPIKFDSFFIRRNKVLEVAPGIIKFEGNRLFLVRGQLEPYNALGQYKTRPTDFSGKGKAAVREWIERPDDE